MAKSKSSLIFFLLKFLFLVNLSYQANGCGWKLVVPDAYSREYCFNVYFFVGD